MDHGDHAPHLLHESLQDVLGPAILPPLPPRAQPAGKGGGKASSPAPGATADDEARLRRLGQEWTIPPEEMAKRCVLGVCCVGCLMARLMALPWTDSSSSTTHPYTHTHLHGQAGLPAAPHLHHRPDHRQGFG